MALLCVMCRVVPGAALVLALYGPAAAQVSGPTPVPSSERGSCPAPIWPKKSLRNEETGTVAVAFLVGPDGKVLENKLARSSGHALLDEASLQNNRECRFAAPPAGEPAQWKTMELVWTLKDAPAALGGGAGAPPPGASYFRDLGRVVTQIRVVDWTFDICASKHPHTSDANAVAVRDWKARHRDLIAEMDGALQALPAYWAGRDPASAKAGPALWQSLNRQLDQGRDYLSQQYLVQLGAEKLAAVCANYPTALGREAFDIERRYPAEIASVRRGPR